MLPNVSALSVIQAAGLTHYSHEKFLRSRFSALPKRFRPSVNKRYIQLFQEQDFRAANLMLVDKTEVLEGKGGLFAASDSELCAYAKSCAKQAFSIASRFVMPIMALHAVQDFTVSKGMLPPNEKLTGRGRLSRMLCDKWWRRAIRKSIARDVENMAIDLGLVSKQTGIYASDETVARRGQQKRRNKDLLKTIIAVNELGDEFTLEALSDLNVSNPKLRRAELMTRIAGFDELAKLANHAADFYTLTCPSKYHAVGYDGKPNPKYQQFTPKEAQQFLTKIWALVRAYLAKNGVKVYGFRVAEPHHDATPHWHMILFYEQKHTDFVRDAIRSYWLAVDGDEKGASDYRFKVIAIDRSRGSAAGYLAKYIAKNIDAYGVENEFDDEGGKLADNAARVDAWAACWGIRQFQQIGGAPVGVWRELRRLGAVTDGSGLLVDLQEACDNANWAKYTELQGGVFVMRKNLAARALRVWFDGMRTLYDGMGSYRVQGVETAAGDYEKTRLHDWVLKRAGVSPSWSSVNNCNQENENLQPLDENLLHWVRQKVGEPPIFDEILEGESINKYDKRVFLNECKR